MKRFGVEQGGEFYFVRDLSDDTPASDVPHATYREALDEADRFQRGEHVRQHAVDILLMWLPGYFGEVSSRMTVVSFAEDHVIVDVGSTDVTHRYRVGLAVEVA